MPGKGRFPRIISLPFLVVRLCEVYGPIYTLQGGIGTLWSYLSVRPYVFERRVASAPSVVYGPLVEASRDFAKARRSTECAFQA